MFRSCYKVGDYFVVNGATTFSDGSVVQLYKDDGTENPLFKLISGNTGFKCCDGEPGAYVNLEFVTKIDWSNKEEYMSNFKLKKGMYFSVEGMTQEDFNKIIELADQQGINLWGGPDEVSDFCDAITHFIIDSEADLITNMNFAGSIESCIDVLVDHGLSPEEISYRDILGEETTQINTESHADDYIPLLTTIDCLSKADQRMGGSSKIRDILERLCGEAAEMLKK